MAIPYASPAVKAVASRPVKARAMQFKYQGDTQETMHHAQRIANCLDVELHCVGDQGALFVHLKIDEHHSPIVSHEDWILVDSFGKIKILKDSEFKVYYEPE